MNATAGIFGEGSLIFRQMTPGTLAFCIVAAAGLVAVAYALQLSGYRRGARAAAYALRLAVVVAILLVLCEPVLRSSEVIPQQSFLVHLFDTSGSMAIADYDRRLRIDALDEVALDSKARAELDRVYQPLDFSFDEHLSAWDTQGSLEASGRATDLAGALRSLQSQITGLPVTGVILYSDGNPTLEENAQRIVDAAAHLEVPVYCVGAGPETPGPDVWVEEVIHPEEAVKGAVTAVNVLVGSRGAPETVTVTLFDAERRLDQRALHPAQQEQVMNAHFQVRSGELGLNGYRVEVAASGEESYPWNNEADFFISTVQERKRILYVEGYPRHEYSALRAAFEDDERFQVTSLVQVSSRNKTYRQGLSDPNELRGGFPDSEEELFKYDVVVIGDISARYFDTQQLTALREFVRRKGGGLLFLGGEDSFAANGYGQTPLADVLPFTFSSHAGLEDEYFVSPTPEGIERGLFGPYDPRRDAEAPWAVLPPLKGVFSLDALKPGAIALCRAHQEPGRDGPPVVAFQRYGRGTSLVCGISGTWQWKFQTPSDNPSYSAFWKEMTLILMEQSGGRIRVDATPPIVSAGSEVDLSVATYDRAFQPDPSAAVSLEIESPSGKTHSVTPHPVADAPPGTFHYRLNPSETGLYRVTAGARQTDGEALVEHRCMFVVREDEPELREVRLNGPLLRQIAEMTQGGYIHLSKYDELPDGIQPREGSLRRVSEHPVWDRPAFLYGILGALLVEWLIRRIGNMA